MAHHHINIFYIINEIMIVIITIMIILKITTTTTRIKIMTVIVTSIIIMIIRMILTTILTLGVQVGAVVVGHDRNINYYKIQYATLCIRENPGCQFIATNLDAVTHLTGGWIPDTAAVFVHGDPRSCTTLTPPPCGDIFSIMMIMVPDYYLQWRSEGMLGAGSCRCTRVGGQRRHGRCHQG